MQNRNAQTVHAALMSALGELRRAEQRAVVQFAEILKRRLYLQLGHPSIQAYAAAELGFTDNKIREFIRLARSLDELPGLKRALQDGEIDWTKARTVARVATPRNEGSWLALAKKGSNRELEDKVRRARHRSTHASPDLFAESNAPAAAPRSAHAEPESLPAPRSQAAFSLPPELKAKLEACIETLRKRGDRRSREELLIAAFDALVNGSPASRDAKSTPYQIVIYKCQACGEARLPTGAKLEGSVAAAAECDCRIHKAGARSRASIPPARRREVLVRDGHRCRTPGCGRTQFLEVHHQQPRCQGGGNGVDNLITLCSACHRLLHDKPEIAASLRIGAPPFASRDANQFA